MKLPRTDFRSFCVPLVCLAIFFFALESRAAALRISPSLVTGGNGSAQQLAVTGGFSPYIWSATVGGFPPQNIGPSGTTALWRAGGMYWNEAAILVLSIVNEIPPSDGTLYFQTPGATGPVIGGVQWTRIRYDYYNCSGQLYRVEFPYDWWPPSYTEWLFARDTSPGNPRDVRSPWAKAAG